MSIGRTLIFFGAHPDDETFGPGATLAQYANSGVKVYYVCATRGEAGTVDQTYKKGFASIADLRTSEMLCAAKALGLTDVIFLGYRDSGMPGSRDNNDPDALIAAPVDQVAGKMVKIIRQIKPDVIIAPDAGGGYGHPDHIAVHNAVVKAFYAANDPTQYKDAEPAFQPSKLYFTIRPHGFIKLAVRLMPLFGQNPRRFGRNKDIDLTKIAKEEYPVNAAIRLSRRAVRMQHEASICHASQGGAKPWAGIFRIVRLLESVGGARDFFMREFPEPLNRREKDLFEGLK